MDDFLIPDEELEALRKLLEEGRLQPLRDRYDGARRIRLELERFSSRIWLFPFGAQPSSQHNVQVFRNGMPQWMDHEVKLFRLRGRTTLTVAVFIHDVPEGDRIQASYITVPTT